MKRVLLALAIALGLWMAPFPFASADEPKDEDKGHEKKEAPKPPSAWEVMKKHYARSRAASPRWTPTGTARSPRRT